MQPPRDPPLLHGRASWLLRQAAIVLVAVFVYFRVRGLTETATDTAVAHAHRLVDLEQHLGIHVEPDLQGPLDGPAAGAEALETLANWIYIWGHWPVIIATMVWLGWRHHEEFLVLRDSMLVSGALGILVFVSYPVAPPRLADLGLVDTVTESSQSYRVLQPPGFVNQYAALPSLHVGWDLLVGIAIWSATGAVVLRVLACLGPVAMAWAVVATANHFVLDVVAGVALVLVGRVVALRLQRRRLERRVPGDGPPR